MCQGPLAGLLHIVEGYIWRAADLGDAVVLSCIFYYLGVVAVSVRVIELTCKPKLSRG